MTLLERKQAPEKMQTQEWFYLLFIIVAAVLFRWVLLLKIPAIGFDEVNYLKLAASGRLNGLTHVFHPYWAPLYPLTVAILAYLIPDFECAGHLVQILCSTLVIFPIFFFVERNFNQKIAFGTSLLIAFFTFSARFSARTETEFLYSLVAILGILAGWQALKHKKLLAAGAAGVFWGLAYLTRPEGVGFLIIFGILSLVVILYQLLQRSKILTSLALLGLAIFGFSVVAAPNIIYLHRVTGDWTLSSKAKINQLGEMYVANKSAFKEHPFRSLSPDDQILLEDEIYHTGNFINIIQKQPQPAVKISASNYIKKLTENYYDLLTRDLAQVLTFGGVLLLGLGLFAASWSRSKILLNLYLLSYVCCFWFGLIPAFHITLRYFVPLLPLSFIWMAAGAVHLIRWFQQTLAEIFKTWPRWLPLPLVSTLAVIFLVLGGSILPELGKRLSASANAIDEWSPAIEQKQAGLWLKQHGVKSPIIMAYNHAVSFYAGNYQIKESVEIPENKLERILNYARHRNVNYLVINDRYRQYYPLLEHLYSEQDIPADLKLVYFDKEPNGLRTWIYEIQN